jgi:hypothetical protein
VRVEAHSSPARARLAASTSRAAPVSLTTWNHSNGPAVALVRQRSVLSDHDLRPIQRIQAAGMCSYLLV